MVQSVYCFYFIQECFEFFYNRIRADYSCHIILEIVVAITYIFILQLSAF